MNSFVSALKTEITKIAKKEIRAEIQGLKKSVAGHRSDIAALKRQVADLQKQNKRLAKSKGMPDTPSTTNNRVEESESSSLRFRPQGLASHRQRLGLSAHAMGKLLGVSGQSVTAWENGRTAPRRNQLPTIAEIRKLGKREAAARLSRI